jgi:hypothetical protein
MKKLILISLIYLLFIIGCGDELGGVMLQNEISKETNEYINKNILNSSEKLVAYYDVTIMMNNSESATLTDKRVVYHKDDRNSSILYEKIKKIDHKYKSLIGDTILIESVSDDVIKIEIAPLNDGEIFLDLLKKRTPNL